MKLAIVTQAGTFFGIQMGFSHQKVARDIYNALKNKRDTQHQSVDISMYDWEAKDIPEKNILFIATITHPTLSYLTRFSDKNVVFYTTTEGFPILDPMSYEIAKNIKIIANSDFTKLMIESTQLVCDGVVPHGIDMTDKEIDKPFYTTMKKAIKTKKVILTVAANIQRKGIDNLLLAVKLVEREIPDVFSILHSGGGFFDISGIAQRLQLKQFWPTNCFTLYDEKKMNTLYKLCKIYVCPSFVEGYGLPIIEAFRHNKPVIAVNTSPMSDLIDHGKTGLLIPMKDVQKLRWENLMIQQLHTYSVDDLADSIITLLTDKKMRKRMARKIGQGKKQFDSENYSALMEYF